MLSKNLFSNVDPCKQQPVETNIKFKVISGGQTGVDRAAFDAARSSPSILAAPVSQAGLVFINRAWSYS